MAASLFFYGNYEGSNNKSIFGGGIATVPTAAMRNGDFRGTAIAPIDPQTGLAFPDRVIPSNRIDPAARAIMDFFYPLPNQGTFANGYGRFQQFVPKTRERHRGDLRIDHQASDSDSMFVRGSYQHRNPNSITFEAGNALTNMPNLNTELNTASLIGGWTKIFSADGCQRVPRGLQLRQFRACEHVHRGGRGQAARHRERAQSRAGSARVPVSSSSPQVPNRPTNITDAGRNVDRTLRQNAFSLSNNLTWIKGGHTLKGGGLWTHNTARDGFGFGVNYRGRYRFRGTSTGNAFTDFLLGLPTDARDHISNRGPLEGHSNDIAGFVQDDWRASKSLTVFLGLRYEVVGDVARELTDPRELCAPRRWLPRRAQRSSCCAAAAWPDRARTALVRQTKWASPRR